MFEIVDRICEFCGKDYRNEYTTSDVYGYKYSIPTRFCSKRCSSKARNHGSNSPIKKDPGKEVIETEIRNFIVDENRYCTKDEILQVIKRSCKTIHKHEISIVELNKELGHTRVGSIFQNKVESILKEAYENVEVEKSFEGLVGNTGYPLRVDFYIPELNMVVEADGTQHSDKNHPWARFKNGSVVEYDSIKEKFLRENNISLIRIPYKKRLKSEEVLSTISNI
jgi:hypothetical protein